MKTAKSFSPNSLPDFLQVDMALQGSQQAYKTLFKRYWKQLFFSVNKLVHDKDEAKDVTMEAFTKAFGNLHRFKKDYGFNTWLYRIALNHSLDYVRKKRLPTTPLSTFVSENDSEYFSYGNDQDWQTKNAEEQIMERQRDILIGRHLHGLPPKYRDVATLRFLEEYSYEEISLSLNVPLGTVKARLHRARYLLQKSLTPCRQSL